MSKFKNIEPKGGTVVLSVRVPISVEEDIKTNCEKSGISTSDYLFDLIVTDLYKNRVKKETQNE